MDNRIELMDRRRRILLTWLFWGFGGWFVMFLIYWTISIAIAVAHDVDANQGSIGSINRYVLYGGVGIAAVFLFFLARWWLYKRSLQKDPVLRAAVNDELVEQSWLKAFRFSFFCFIALLVLNIFGFIGQIFLVRSVTPEKYGRISAFTGIFSSSFFYLFVAIMSCIGSFLRFSRERL